VLFIDGVQKTREATFLGAKVVDTNLVPWHLTVAVQESGGNKGYISGGMPDSEGPHPLIRAAQMRGPLSVLSAA
jgi:hypothetical protein